ncbi:unnamed protein product [Rangifer tarandus platyrhynchus]|uniref:Uncharacterized protein n=2 Tax=Rangifer tarandus platyrhynchus TaxID=3082113 RepID=A0AC59YBG0_RANTA|nr:unnamed protein product [Rangifer tarandus platyrhynchus]
MEPRKLHTPLTYMVLFLRFNLAETTSAWPLQSGGQAQQKPDLVKLPWQKLNAKIPAQWKGPEAQHAGNQNSKNKLSRKLMRLSLRLQETSCSGRNPSSYGWKDIWLTKS